MKLIRLILILIVSNTFATSVALSQDSLSAPSDTWGWIGISLGPATGSNFSGFVGGATISYVKNSQIYSVRFLHAEEPSLAEPTNQFNSTSNKLHAVSDASVLYGFASKERFFLFSISAGIGYVWGSNSPQTSSLDFRTIAIPVDLQVGFSPIKGIGVSLYCFANFNPTISFYGMMLCLQLGKT